jgi:hypothetical protein
MVDTIHITTAEEFVALKSLSNKGSSSDPISILIDNDLDFSDITDFTGLNSIFYAVFDGQGHTIKNIVSNCPAVTTYFLGRYDSGEFKNLKISNCHITWQGGSSSLVFAFMHGSTATSVTNVIIDNSNTFLFGNGYAVAMYINVASIHKCGIGGRYIGLSSSVAFQPIYNNTGNKPIQNSYVIGTFENFGNVYTFSNSGTHYNCFSRVDVKNCVNMYGFTSNNAPTYFCYNASTVAVTGYNYGFCAGTGNKIQCYYDNTLNPYASDTSFGQPTENLKSVEWLRSQGWAI